MSTRPMFLIGLVMCCGVARSGTTTEHPRDTDSSDPERLRVSPPFRLQSPATQPTDPQWQLRFQTPYGDPYFAVPRQWPFDPYLARPRSPSTQPGDPLSRQPHFQFNGRTVFVVPLETTTQATNAGN